MMSVPTGKNQAEKILWASVSRRDTVLVEAGDQDLFEGAVAVAANQIMAKKSTPGWEYSTLKMQKYKTIGAVVPKQLKAMKFHVYEHSYGNAWDGKGPNSSKSNRNNSQQQPGESTIWVFAAVYNPQAWTTTTPRGVITADVKSFLQKIVGLTSMSRLDDEEWKTGSTLACQLAFEPLLLQRMQEVTYLGSMARLNESVSTATELMQSNISAILEQQESLQHMEEESNKLQRMSAAFKKQSAGVRRRMMLQNAKHGLALGTAITAAVAIIVIPPLLVIL